MVSMTGIAETFLGKSTDFTGAAPRTSYPETAAGVTARSVACGRAPFPWLVDGGYQTIDLGRGLRYYRLGSTPVLRRTGKDGLCSDESQ